MDQVVEHPARNGNLGSLVCEDEYGAEHHDLVADRQFHLVQFTMANSRQWNIGARTVRLLQRRWQDLGGLVVSLEIPERDAAAYER